MTKEVKMEISFMDDEGSWDFESYKGTLEECVAHLRSKAGCRDYANCDVEIGGKKLKLIHGRFFKDHKQVDPLAFWGEDDRSIVEVMDELALRVEYLSYLGERSGWPVSYQEWRERRVITNPATLDQMGKL